MSGSKKLFIALLAILFVGSLSLQSCSSSKPGFSKSGKAKGSKVRSSGKMY